MSRTTTAVPARPRITVVAGLAASAVTMASAAALHAAGVSFDVGGEMIPIPAFAQLTMVGAVVGGVLLAVLNRREALGAAVRAGP